MVKKRVLIVEDEAVQTAVFEKIIKQVNVKSHLVSNGRDAIEFLKNETDVGLVLLDLALPDISGLQVLEELKKMQNKIPVAILSATEDSNVILRAGQLGAIEFFVKGKNKEELIRLFEFVDRMINHS